jgi:CotS family spore coat protein
LEVNQIREIVENNYNIHIVDIEKVKNVYKIGSGEEQYCLKVIKYELPHFLFILGAIKHLQDNGFEKIPPIIKTKKDESFVKLGDFHGYLTPWLEARKCNYDNPLDIATAATKLAQLHLRSRGFEVAPYMKPRVGWFKWIETFKTRRREILDFRRIICAKEKHTDFDVMYIDSMKEELERCDRAIDNLINSEYLSKMNSEIQYKGFCHHDFAHHNVLIEKDGSVNLIDFDYTILDTHLHDLSSFLIRSMKYGKWSLENARHLLDAYNSVYEVEDTDIPVMAAFMEFPQDYWQRGIQYYWEKQAWGEEFFLKKLSYLLEDRDEKQEFIDEFRTTKYRG